MKQVSAALAVLLAASVAGATPHTKRDETRLVAPRLTHNDARARVATYEPAKRGVLSPEEDTAQQIEKLLRGPLRGGVTGLYVVDATSGDPIFAVNADDHLNPASNVKMISMAASLEALGPDFRYATRLLGAPPGQDKAIRSNVYLLGSWDPTLVGKDMADIADGLAARGVVALHGDLIVGGDGARDGTLRPSVPIEVAATTPGMPVKATVPAGFELVRTVVTAKTLPYAAPARLTAKLAATKDDKGRPRVVVEIGGTIGKGGTTTYDVALTPADRANATAYALRAALVARGIVVTGDVRVEELGDFVGESLANGDVPIELGRHASRPLAAIVRDVNKWSVNWLADRVILSAAALTHHAPPTMELAVDTMYDWLARHAKVGRDDLVVDTGSGLSYRTQITPKELVAVVLGASGFAKDGLAMDAPIAAAWRASLSVAGNDGTLMNRFKATDLRGRIIGKTGTLSTAIALSGLVEIDPARPLAFALVTNTNAPLAKATVRKTHEALVTAICKYAARTAKHPVAAPAPAAGLQLPAAETAHPTMPDDEETPPDGLGDAPP